MSCFRGPWPPTKSAYAHELADFCETEAIRHGTYSGHSLAQDIGLLGEEDPDDGIPSSEWDEATLSAVFGEIADRKRRCAAGYPFAVINDGYTICRDTALLTTPACRLYLYMLIATRFNMTKSRDHAGIDGTLVFEHICSEVARAYLGCGARSWLLGTASSGVSFQDKVNSMCRDLGEGDGADPGAYGNMSAAKDGKVDVVVWKPFADARPGKLIGMGQCKTGSSYDDAVAHLQPDVFFRKFCRRAPVAGTPFRMFFITETFGDTPAPSDPDGKKWTDIAASAGIVFDRCRIMEFSTALNHKVREQVDAWVTAAAASVGLHIAG